MNWYGSMLNFLNRVFTKMATTPKKVFFVKHMNPNPISGNLGNVEKRIHRILMDEWEDAW